MDCPKRQKSPINAAEYEQAERCEEIREIFEHFDRDGSGSLEFKELRALTESLGGKISDEELRAGFHLVDQNNNGRISFREFARWWQNR